MIFDQKWFPKQASWLRHINTRFNPFMTEADIMKGLNENH